ncbi:MAG: phosphoribosylaminoimidazolesuccinocarboxamide synthase [Bdellovibrionia bacterium]
MSQVMNSHFYPSSFSVLYRGSVKDLRGPTDLASKDGNVPGVVFDYSDAYSVFDWGRMPDLLAKKGHSLALIAADWFEKIERPETWKEFSRTPDATALRKGNRFGASFNELGEELQKSGLRTHYIGMLQEASSEREMSPGALRPLPLSDLQKPARHLAVKQVSVVKPAMQTVLGRAVPDYLPTRNAPAPRLIPLEVIFRFSCPQGSSLSERVARDPGYMASIGFGDFKVAEGEKWDFPVLELFTKLETTDRPLTLTEALAISGLSGAQMQRLLLKTAWVAGWLKSLCARSGVELADGKLEWALLESGDVMLVDAVGPDELRLLKNGVQLSKEFLRNFYRGSSWYQAVNRAKELGRSHGVAEWKKLAAEQPPVLTPRHKELATNLYQALANQLTGRQWFPQAMTLDQVVKGIQEISTST